MTGEKDRGTPLEEMDLPAVLARRPELCLIDELAHTNAPGVEHEKRFEDVRDVLDAGIDVFSTVNVQHLESLGDQVTQLTGAHVRETIPDAVLSAADEEGAGPQGGVEGADAERVGVEDCSRAR